jgi:uncharacterized membrane protein YbhN (UPF0104 family)
MHTEDRSTPALFTPARKLGLALTALVYLLGAAAVYHFIDRATVQTALSLPMKVVGMLLGLSLLNYVVRAWRWQVLGNFLGFRVPARNNILYYLSGYCFTATPGKAGEAVRLWFLKSGHDVPYARSVPLMLADRILDMWAVMLLTLVSFAGFAAYLWQGALLAVIVLVVSLPILFPRWLDPLVLMLGRWMPTRKRLVERGRELLTAMQELSSWRTYGLTLLPSIAGWAAEGAALYVLLHHFGAPVTLSNAIFVFSFSMIVGAISMLPGGLGSTEATIVILLKALGVDLSTALAATAIVRITTFWFAVVIGVLLMPAAMNAAKRAGRALPTVRQGAV